MKKVSSVKLNFIMNFILTISNFIFPLITFPYVSRVLQAEGVGTINFATSIITYFSMIGMLGIPTYGIRACAKVRDDKEKLDKTVFEIMLLNSLVMGLSLMLLFISVISIEKLASEKVLYLVLSSTLVFNVLGVDWLYRSLERYTYITIRSILFKLFSVILMFLFVRTSDDYVIYGAITVVAAVGSNLLNFINLHKIISLRPINELNIFQHLKPTLTFFLLTVSTTIYLNVDTTMLGFIKGSKEVGYYSAAVKVKQILVSVVTSLGAVLLPRLSYYYEQGKMEDFERLTQKALNFVFIVSLPMVAYFILVSKQAILFLSGESFLPAVLPMQLIMPTVLFIGLSNLMGIQILVPTNREKLVVYSTIVGAVVDIIVNVFAIPALGASGAAIAGTIAECSVTIVQFLFLKEFILPIFKKIHFVKISLSLVLATMLTVGMLTVIQLNVFWTLAVSASLFFVVYGISLFLQREEFVVEIWNLILSKVKKIGV
ncbi:TPA: flippase [Streptococcus suis]|nr:flippase [Streptococcus suis]HEM5229743.1 flippase [Streptococcus suis]HEM5247048.1 flippase [Streptococcus suis]HEM5248383.1 flippase [Streptococcus suis]HEO8635052.1 flippase [Streptococcus suis]